MILVSSPRAGAERAPSPIGYSVRQAAKLLDLSERQVLGFVRAGFLEPRRGHRGEYRFTFPDLVVLRTAKALSENLSPRKVKRALARLREQLPRGRDLSALRVTAEGDEVVVRDGSQAWNPESGQTQIEFDVAELAAEVAPLAQEAAEAARESPEGLSAEDWFELGCDLETHTPDQARDAYRRALELAPRHADSHVNLGRLLHESGEVRAAEAHYRLALESRPQDATAAFNLGVSLGDLGRRDEAIRAYARALEIDPRYADAHFNLAQLYEERARPRLALKHLQIYRRLMGES